MGNTGQRIRLRRGCGVASPPTPSRLCKSYGEPGATAWQAEGGGGQRIESGGWRIALQDGRKQDGSVDAIAEKLDTKLGKWKPEISQEVRSLVSQVIDAADNDALDVMRSRAAEQEVLDQLNEPPSR